MSGFPKAPDCESYNEDFVSFLHGRAGKAACGGAQGFDKLAHCMDNCMWTMCLPPGVGAVVCIVGQTVMKEDDPEDIIANEIGRGIGLTATSGQECFDRCAKAVYGLEAW